METCESQGSRENAALFRGTEKSPLNHVYNSGPPILRMYLRSAACWSVSFFCLVADSLAGPRWRQ